MTLPPWLIWALAKLGWMVGGLVILAALLLLAVWWIDQDKDLK